MRIEKFEDIEAWQEARVLCRFVYEATDEPAVKGKDLVGGFIRYLRSADERQPRSSGRKPNIERRT